MDGTLRTGGGHFGLQVDGADEDDDLMTVKRVNHRLSDGAAVHGGGSDADEDDDEDDEEKNLSSAARSALADGPADLGAALRARAKKGKLRIKTGGHGGNERVVFGDDGESMAPLEALGRKDLGPVPTGGAELAAAAKAHYDKVRGERLVADKTDRLREKQRLRDMRDKAKVKARKEAGDYDSDDSDGGGGDGGAVVTLGRASDSEGDDDDDNDDDDSDSDSGGGGGGGGRGRKRGGGGGGGGDDSDSSESDSDEAHYQAKRTKRVETAHAGMALKKEDENIESLEERAMRLLQGK